MSVLKNPPDMTPDVHIFVHEDQFEEDRVSQTDSDSVSHDRVLVNQTLYQKSNPQHF